MNSNSKIIFFILHYRAFLNLKLTTTPFVQIQNCLHDLVDRAFNVPVLSKNIEMKYILLTIVFYLMFCPITFYVMYLFLETMFRMRYI